MKKISELLGTDFFVEGTVEHGKVLAQEIFPDNQSDPPKQKLMPPNGVYVTVSKFGETEYQGITNVGYKPTIGEDFLGVETYLLTATGICMDRTA